MEISSVSSQAMVLKENMTQLQLGTVAIKQTADAQAKLADMLATRAQAISPAENPEEGRLDTYA